MTTESKLTLALEGDQGLLITRRFSAPPEAVYRAHLEVELIRQWLLGPDGWSMTVCISDPVVGGRIHFEWSDGQGGDFSLTGEYLELVPFSKIVHVERMHLPDPTPDNRVETRFEAVEGGTLVTLRMTLPDAETRRTMLESDMESGMNASYDKLDSALSET
ncbi:MAG: SRPBCC domain-containing protein [Acidobacteriota bacterium]